ncbi:bifunctional precorrin-2 dehydrogenase/sirohydrochlorin ferrochelatase [Fusibacter sp. 3D3]|uniref:precorrin-2 dehydrogenase/sirohydrochlorin ferrochelatase family protein n=1 Tax=Fusibacter sp. 3D3 TaxID=1048380 RepID=UPI0008537A73|nr:NAD(P)-dependent oxidoreductase [Fusibacter sp. 3D3]GAU76888.1 siroheme synthase / Precorrin-2 oxidase [Fusibacter sp. 3D3]
MTNKPVLLNCDFLNVLIIGGGKVGFRKASGFVDKCATLTVLSPELCIEFTELVDKNNWRYIPMTYDAFCKQNRALLMSMHLIYACTNQPSVNAKISEEGKRFGKLVNRTDQHEFSHFSDMLYQDQDTHLIAVSGKGSPWGSKILMDYLVQNLPATLIQRLSLLRKGRAQLQAQGLKFDEIKKMSIDQLERILKDENH